MTVVVFRRIAIQHIVYPICKLYVCIITTSRPPIQSFSANGIQRILYRLQSAYYSYASSESFSRNYLALFEHRSLATTAFGISDSGTCIALRPVTQFLAYIITTLALVAHDFTITAALNAGEPPHKNQPQGVGHTTSLVGLEARYVSVAICVIVERVSQLSGCVLQDKFNA